MYTDLITVGARLQHLVSGISKQTSSVHDDSVLTSLQFVPDLGEPSVVLNLLNISSHDTMALKEAIQKYAERTGYFTATVSQENPHHKPTLKLTVPESKANQFLSNWNEFMQEIYPAVTTTITARLQHGARELRSVADIMPAAAGTSRFGNTDHPLIAQHALGGRD